MFFPGSRYTDIGTYQATRPDGSTITVTRLPLPGPAPVQGWHRRSDTEHLDLLASHYLGDPTAAWALGWANRAMSLDALGVHDLIAIPRRS